MLIFQIIMCVIFAALIAVLLTGHGSFLIAGYNTATPKEREKYDQKKLCRVIGAGIAVVPLMILIWIIGGEALNKYVSVFPIVIVADCVVMLILANTICKKKL